VGRAQFVAHAGEELVLARLAASAQRAATRALRCLLSTVIHSTAARKTAENTARRPDAR
jgi:hypothetical protein